MILRLLRAPDDKGTLTRVWEKTSKLDIPDALNDMHLSIDNMDATQVQIYISGLAYNHMKTQGYKEMYLTLLTILNTFGTRHKNKNKHSECDILLPERALEHPPFSNIKDSRKRSNILWKFYFPGSPITPLDRKEIGLVTTVNYWQAGSHNIVADILYPINNMDPALSNQISDTRGRSLTNTAISTCCNWINKQYTEWNQAVSRSISEEIYGNYKQF